MWRKKNEIKIFPKFFKTRCPKSTCFTAITYERHSEGEFRSLAEQGLCQGPTVPSYYQNSSGEDIAVKWKRSRLYSFILAFLMLMACIQTQAAAANLPPGTSKAVVFLLDASNSMNTNDRERLAKDSIAQLIYSLPSNYYVGFAAYNTSVVASIGMQDSSAREPVMEAVDAVAYTGYTNAGAGLTTGMELLETVDAAEKTVVILSDGEIIMNSDEATAESASQFQAAVEAAQAEDVRIHVIGLGADMADEDNTIFSAASQTKGVNYHAPQSTDIQSVIDSILLEQLGVKKTRAAIIDTDGGTEDITVSIPSANTSRTRILLTSGSPIQNLKADFSAVNGWQYSGSRYTLLELDHPTDTAVHITFQGRAGGQVKVDVISEYVLTTKLAAAYTDSEPESPEGEYLDRVAEISAAFYDAGDSDRQMLTDPVFQGLLVPTTAGGNPVTCYLKDGVITFQRAVTADAKLPVQFDFTRLDTNLILEQPVLLDLEGPPALPKPPLEDYRPQIIVGALILLALISMLIIWLASRRKKAKAVASPAAPTAPATAAPAARVEEPGRYGYVGRLNIYITNTLSGHDFPPLTYNLFRIPGGKKLSLQEILDGCEVDEPFEGADKIFFQPGAGHCLLLTNESDCTLMQNREILMKGRSYQISLNSKVDITFEDERSEIALQYRDVKPSDMRLLAGEPH